MSGYFRMSADEWEPEHYRSRWTTENRAPRWWAWADASWYIDRRRLPAARKLAEEWGWTKSVAYAFARNVAIAQLGWELRADVREYLDALISTDKTRTRTIKTQGQNPDNRTPANADNPFDGRTNGGHFADTSRTDRGHLTGARSESSSTPAATATATGTPEIAPAVAGRASSKSSRKLSAAYQLAIDAFNLEHIARMGAAYPWIFHGRDADGARVKAWLAAARVDADQPAGGVERIRLAARAYLAAVQARTAWPAGEPAQTRHFTRDLARWLQTDPGARPAIELAARPRSRSDDRRESLAALDVALQRALEREHAERVRDHQEPPDAEAQHPGGRSAGAG